MYYDIILIMFTRDKLQKYQESTKIDLQKVLSFFAFSFGLVSLQLKRHSQRYFSCRFLLQKWCRNSESVALQFPL